MPPFTDILHFLGGQAFGSTTIPQLDLSGKTMVITGANTGLGLECAKHLVRLRISNLILACRNIDKGNAAMKHILTETQYDQHHTTIEVWGVDLASYGSTLAFSERVRSQLQRLDGFVCNAAVEALQFSVSEGLETSLTVNVVSTFLLAIAVLPKLQQTAASYAVQTNLTIVGSMMHTFGPDSQLVVPENKQILEELSNEKTADMGQRYALTKLMCHLCYHELAKWQANRQESVVINVLNPGWCKTELNRSKDEGLLIKLNFAVLGWSAEKGSRNLVYGVTAGKDTHDKYISECQVKPESQFMRSERGRKIQQRLWSELLARMEKISPVTIALLR